MIPIGRKVGSCMNNLFANQVTLSSLQIYRQTDMVKSIRLLALIHSVQVALGAAACFLLHNCNIPFSESFSMGTGYNWKSFLATHAPFVSCKLRQILEFVSCNMLICSISAAKNLFWCSKSPLPLPMPAPGAPLPLRQSGVF